MEAREEVYGKLSELLTKENNSIEQLEKLEKAFLSFNEASSKIQEQYSILEKRVEFLTNELERKNRHLQSALSEKDRSQNYLNNVLESLSVGVIVIDLKGILRKINRQAINLLGADKYCFLMLSKSAERDKAVTEGEKSGKKVVSESSFEELFGKDNVCEFPEICFEDFCPLLAKSDVYQKACLKSFREMFSGELGLSYEEAVIKKIEIKIDPAVDNKGNIFGGVITLRDISELKRLEKQLQIRSRLTGMGEIAINVAHEIRNPLGSMELFASMLQRELNAGSNLGGYVENIVFGIRNIENIVSNILLFTRSQKPSFEYINIEDVISETLSMIELLLEQKSIVLDLNICSNETRIPADRELLKQVYLNLFLNAVQAMISGGVLKIEIFSDSGYVYARVSDTGKGIPREIIEKIFDPFFTTKRNGTGLGLAIVHNIIRMHEGFIEADSVTGKGTSFLTGFPVRKSDGQK